MLVDSWNVIVYLNRAGLGDDYESSQSEQPAYRKFEHSYAALQSRLIKNVTVCFDPGNPRSMIRANRQPRTAVICIQSSAFELSAEWFHEALRSALQTKPRNGQLELNEEDGRALCDATKDFLHFVGGQLQNMELSAVAPSQRFALRKRPQSDGGQPDKLSLDLRDDAREGYPIFLRLWWLCLDSLCGGVDGALRRQVLADDQEAQAIRATVLKLRAHLAASLLELGESDDSNLRLALHESMLEWMEFNLESRTRDDDLEYLYDRHQELGDLLFEVAPARRWFSWPPELAPNGSSAGARTWQSARRIKMRRAIDTIESMPKSSKTRDIIERYEGLLRRAGELFSRRFDVRELVTVSGAGLEIRKSQIRRERFARRARTFAQGTLRHLPWPYLAFLILGLLGWLTFAASVLTRSFSRLEGFRKLAQDAAFSAQFSIVYLLVLYFVFSRWPRKVRLFRQAMPRILGSLILGFAPLWLEEETWTFPFSMSWEAILGCVAVLLLITYLYFAVEVSSKIKVPSEARQKAVAVFLIAAAQAYGIGLLITDFAACHFIPTMPFPNKGGLLNEILETGQRVLIWNPFALFRPAVQSVGLLAWLDNFVDHHFWLLPKLLILWFGLAMFAGVFLHMLWEKEGILDRL